MTSVSTEDLNYPRHPPSLISLRPNKKVSVLWVMGLNFRQAHILFIYIFFTEKYI